MFEIAYYFCLSAFFKQKITFFIQNWLLFCFKKNRKTVFRKQVTSCFFRVSYLILNIMTFYSHINIKPFLCEIDWNLFLNYYFTNTLGLFFIKKQIQTMVSLVLFVGYQSLPHPRTHTHKHQSKQQEDLIYWLLRCILNWRKN